MTKANIDSVLGSLDDLRRILIAHARRIGVFEQDIDDVVQEAFFNLYNARDKIVVGGNVRSFAMSTVRNVFYNRLRHQKHVRAAIDVMMLSPGYTPPVNGARLEIAEAVGAMKRVLSSKERINLTMDILGYDIHERSAAVGWPVPSVKTRTSMARRKVIAALA